MSLPSGTCLGVYRISSLIGKGGMGEVYRARDEKLERDVALKVLPPEFASDLDRFARFGREARLLASLNHPNIAGIHGLDESGNTHFLVLELIDGETLTERLGRSLSVEQALRLAIQLATALEAAHAKGVIHRDLKPSNIKIASDGTLKVLDFGLAKAAAGSDVLPDLSHSPTLSMTATARGVILGTAGYMAPEQARGDTVTRQADVWAFGCILFEMLAGRRVWEGRSVTDLIAALVARDPDWTRLPDNLHPRVRFVLERCLEKEPANRYREIADVRLELTRALADSGGVAPVVVQEKRGSLGRWVVAGVVALAIVGAGIAGWWLKPDPAAPVARYDVPLPQALQQPTVPPFPILAVSQDGTRWIVSTNGRLWVRDIKDTAARPLQGVTTAAAMSPTFSPDGEWVAFVDVPSAGSAVGLAIRRVPITGGSPQTVVPLTIAEPSAALGVDVRWDERDMLTWVQAEGIMQVPANGGTPQLIVRADQGERLASPQVLPGGDTVLFTATKSVGPGRWDTAEIVMQAIGSDERAVVWRGGRDARYLPTGHIVYAQGTTLFSVPFDRSRRQPTGSQMPLVEGLSTAAGGPLASNTAHYAVSDSGVLIYLTGGLLPTAGGSRPPPRTIAWVDRKGVETPIPIRPDDYTMARLSPDGRKIALQLGNPVPEDSNTDIWVYDLDARNSRQLTFEKGDDDGPVWTLDSSRLYFRSLEERATTGGAVYSVSADGGQRTLVAKSPEHPFALPWSLSFNGRTLALVDARSLQKVDLATLDLQEKDSFRSLLPGAALVSEPVLTPNGQWLAYIESAVAGGAAEINIRSFPDVGRQRYPVAPGATPLFSRDGSELFFFDGGGLSVVSIAYEPTLRIGPVRQLFRGQYWWGVAGANGGLGRAWDVDRRGERFLVIRMPGAAAPGETQAPPPPIRVNVVLNFLTELQARASR